MKSLGRTWSSDAHQVQIAVRRAYKVALKSWNDQGQDWGREKHSRENFERNERVANRGILNKI